MPSIRRKILITTVALLGTSGAGACSFVATPPSELIAKRDHGALATWYEQEAGRLRVKTTKMDQMMEAYQRDPEGAKQMMSHGSPKVDFVWQGHVLATGCRKGARDAEALAQAQLEGRP
ncbi:MAG: hypothetical protein ABI856_09750 [Nitrospira sp.]